MRLFWKTTVILLAMSPMIAGAQSGTPKTFKELIKKIGQLFEQGAITLIVAGLVIFLFGAAVNMWKSSESKNSFLKTHLPVGVLILFVMVSVWGILKLMRDTFLGPSQNEISAPFDERTFTP